MFRIRRFPHFPLCLRGGIKIKACAAATIRRVVSASADGSPWRSPLFRREGLVAAGGSPNGKV